LLSGQGGFGSASILDNANRFAQQSDAIGTLQIIAAILVLYAPLVLIPFSFKLAGGAISAVMNAASGRAANLAGRAGKRVQASRENPSGFLGSRVQRGQNIRTQRRSDFAEKMKQNASGTSGMRSRLYRGAAKGVGGYNIEAKSSAVRAQTAKILNDQIATGRDEEIRGLTVDYKKGYAALEAEGRAKTVDGVRQYQSLGGAWVKEADVIAGHNRWGNDSFAQQAALSYEMRKAANDEQVAGISQNYGSLAKNSWGMSDNTAAGAFIGAGFENQNTHLEYKHTDALSGKLKADSFVDEAYEKKGSYPLSNMSAHTAKQLMNAYNAPDATPERKEKIRAISETFMQRGLGGSRQVGMAGEGDAAVPIQQPIPPELMAQQAQQQQQAAAQNVSGGVLLDPQTGRPQPQGQPRGAAPPSGYFGASGAAHVNEAFYELANLTGVVRDGGNPGAPGKSTPGAKQK
jgi:hypothetical protein